MAPRRIAPSVTLLTLLVSGLAVGAPPPPVSAVPTDPTEFGSLRMEPFEGVALDGGEWAILLNGTYFNQWNGTWHTRRVHEGLGLQRQPIQDFELNLLERNFPEDEIYRVDLEGFRADVMVARGFGKGVTGQIRVPWITIGAPEWDAIAELVHDAIPVVDHYVRDLFPKGQTFLYLRTDGRSVVRRNELARSEIGDVALSLSKAIGSRWGLAHRLAVSLEIPTGEKNTIHGSGGWDAGLRWFGDRAGPRSRWQFGAGFTRLDPSGSFLGFDRSHTFHLSADYLRRIGARTAFHGGTRLDTSPLAGVTSTNLADPVLFYRFGIQVETRPGQWIFFDLGEEIAPQMGVDADFSLHLGFSYRSAPARWRAGSGWN